MKWLIVPIGTFETSDCLTLSPRIIYPVINHRFWLPTSFLVLIWSFLKLRFEKVTLLPAIWHIFSIWQSIKAVEEALFGASCHLPLRLLISSNFFTLLRPDLMVSFVFGFQTSKLPVIESVRPVVTQFGLDFWKIA